ncbi:MAG: hypothetical protein RLZ98_1313 [Pseudomonadota bacterium]
MRSVFRHLAAIAILSCASIEPSAAGEARPGFRTYPAFPNGGAVVEMVHDKGLMLELIVKCSRGVAIVTFSKTEGLYCDPQHHCSSNLRGTIGRACQ